MMTRFFIEVDHVADARRPLHRAEIMREEEGQDGEHDQHEGCPTGHEPEQDAKAAKQTDRGDEVGDDSRWEKAAGYPGHLHYRRVLIVANCVKPKTTKTIDVRTRAIV
jgi:hypothetical protein